MTPDELRSQVPLSEKAANTVRAARKAIQGILDGSDPRKFVVIGPCSIHRIGEGLEYAERLTRVAQEVSSSVVVVMRTYFEKPRTVSGWKGFLNDPHLNGTFAIEEGLLAARKFLVQISEHGLAAATEMLDLISPQFIADCIAWSAIGARTTESQSHRQLASGLSMPVGFKNGTSGDIELAANAVIAAAQSHHFLSVSDQGRVSVFETRGNRYGHIILRGGFQPNYDPESVDEAIGILRSKGLNPNIMIDCSHGNSGKDFRNQAKVFRSCLKQIEHGNDAIKGLMLESNLKEGSQKLGSNPADLVHGVSITDGCIGWEETEDLIREAHRILIK
jgi:3-deoxy-7-phosphoheptulonate synthase